MPTTAQRVSSLEMGEMIQVVKMLPSALSNVPFHEDTLAITRYFAENFPVHLAVHKVSPVILPPAAYTLPHLHEDTDEVNIILSEHNLSYKMLLGDEEMITTNNSAIWIPRGVLHAANVISGSGYFITLRTG